MRRTVLLYGDQKTGKSPFISTDIKPDILVFHFSDDEASGTEHDEEKDT